MIKEKNTTRGIDVNIEILIRTHKPFTMILRKNAVVFERCFRPLHGNTFKQTANTYKTTSNPSGTFYKITKVEEMGNISTERDNIFNVVRALEINGYELAEQDWKVI